jgi:uncharacterized protein YdaU (DUF1376 family)
MSKVRRIDWSPDEYIGGTFGRLTVGEHGMYCVVLNMIYSTGGPIDADWQRLAHACKSRPHAMQRLVAALIKKGKLRFTADGRLSNGRADRELGLAAERIEDARRAGRASGAVRRAVGKSGVGAHPPIIRRSTRDESDDPRKRSRGFNRIPERPFVSSPPTIKDHESVSVNHTGAAREPSPEPKAAQSRAHTEPEPERAAAPLSPEAQAARDRLDEITAAKRAAFLKGIK